MTKKDYELIAGALRRAQLVVPGGAVYHSAHVLALANALEAESPRFKRDVFIKAATE